MTFNMASSSVLIILLCGIYSNGIKLTPCKLQDQGCFKTMLKDFLAQTYKGITEYDMKPVDPLFIPSLNIDLQNDNQTILHFKNLTITGLKDEQFQDFELDEKDGTALFLKTINPKINGNLTAEFSKLSKSFDGTFSVKGTTLLEVVTNYKIEVDNKGIKHITFGPERMACEALGKLVVTLSSRLGDALRQDKNLYEKHIRNVFCEITEKAWITVIDNIREITKILPKSKIIIEV